MYDFLTFLFVIAALYSVVLFAELRGMILPFNDPVYRWLVSRSNKR